MKKIEESAIENCGCSHMDCGHCAEYERMYECPYHKKKESFEDGVCFAQKMIPIEEDLPEINEPVLVRTKNGKYKVSSMYIPKDCHGNILGEKRWKGSTSFVESITGWRPITYK